MYELPRSQFDSFIDLSCFPDEHAFWEGEGETTSELFIQQNGAYYRKEGERLGFEFHEKMEALFERFELVYPVQ